jgi:Putative MetA-pathway of phenol degradation
LLGSPNFVENKDMKIHLLIFLFGISFTCIQAQTTIQTDRPDQTECPFITPVGFIQAENGFIYENINKDNKSIILPTILWKYGINKNVELRLITEANTLKSYGNKVSGFVPTIVGFKVSVSEEKGIIPATGFIGHLAIPNAASANFKASYYAPSFRFNMQHTLSNKFTLAYNLGAEWDGETPEPTFIYTLTSGMSITEKLGAYIELYGFAPQNQSADHRADGGFTYLITNDVMVDISGGFGITKESPKNYFALGFSYRLNTKKQKR